jgi:TonB family protein
MAARASARPGIPYKAQRPVAARRGIMNDCIVTDGARPARLLPQLPLLLPPPAPVHAWFALAAITIACGAAPALGQGAAPTTRTAVPTVQAAASSTAASRTSPAPAAQLQVERAATPLALPAAAGEDLAANARRGASRLAAPGANPQSEPARVIITPRTRAAELAGYYQRYAERIECASERAYPQAARGKSFTLMVTASVLADGSLENVQVDRSSGNQEVDGAVAAVVRAAAPFDKFVPEMARYRVADITSQWQFAPRRGRGAPVTQCRPGE